MKDHREFIGTVRHRLFVGHDCEWNGIVRDITAQMEREEMVNTEQVLVQIAEFYRARAHWTNFKANLKGETQ